jgi:hypothetical protein
MTSTLETERLGLREFRRDDLDDLAAMVADEEQMGFYPRSRTRDEASAWMRRPSSATAASGRWSWEASPRTSACGSRVSARLPRLITRRTQAAAGSIDGSPSSLDSASTVPSPSGSASGGSSPPRGVPAISSSPLRSLGMKPDFIPK